MTFKISKICDCEICDKSEKLCWSVTYVVGFDCWVCGMCLKVSGFGDYSV